MQNDVTEHVPLDSRRWLAPVVALLLAICTMAVFWPAVKGEFLTYDDHDYVTGNSMVQQGLTAGTVRWAFQTGHASNWHPITWLSHALDCQIYGLKPAGHHFTNVLLHALNAALLLLLVHRWTGSVWRSAFVAAVFAWHPLRVESVAWVAERKDVLSGFFFFLTLLAYTHFVEFQRLNPPARRPVRFWYITALLLFALGLMSKPSLVTLPFLLVLLDAWPLRRWTPFTPGWGRSLARVLPEKIPFLILTLGSCIATYSVQKAGNAVRDYSWETRLANVPVAYVRYLIKTFYPVDLAVIYPFQPVSVALSIAAAGGVVAICLLAFRLAARNSYLFVGWFWFLGMLVPMIGLIQVGNQALADRYTYLSAIGLVIALVWGVAELAKRYHLVATVRPAMAVALLLVLLPLTRSYVAKWDNTIDLFTHALSVTPPHTVGLKNIGMACMEKQRFSEAQSWFEQSLQIEPGDQPTLFNLGSVILQQGRPKEAVPLLQRALSVTPGFAEAPAYAQLAMLLADTNELATAILFYEKALAANPDLLTALNNLAWLRATTSESALRNGPEAVKLARRACELTGRRAPVFLGTLAAAYAEAGQFAEAIATATEARDLARAGNQVALVQSNEQLLELFRAGKPFRDAPAEK